MKAVCQRLSGRYLSLSVGGTPKEIARGLVNLVNVQGPGEIAIVPGCSRPEVDSALDHMDPKGTWRDWWNRASGEPVTLTQVASASVAAPVHRVGSLETERSPLLGVNVGAHYLRLVRVHAGKVTHGREVRLGTGRDSTLFGISLESFLEMLSHHGLSRGVRSVGIAWSAPRTSVGLRKMSIQLEGAGEVADLLDKGALDAELTKAFGCPVSSWNDGEAAAAAESLTELGHRGRPLLVLKLGTSFASGLALGGGEVSALPMQLAKCLPAIPPPRCFSHPKAGLRGTARDALGAASITQAFRFLADRPHVTYHDYRAAAVRGEPAATRLAQAAARMVAELARLISDLWSPVDLVLTGKNLDEPAYRQAFMGLVRREIADLPSAVTLHGPMSDVNFSAALGAAALSQATT